MEYSLDIVLNNDGTFTCNVMQTIAGVEQTTPVQFQTFATLDLAQAWGQSTLASIVAP